jgi:DNA-binding NtrC family response regulator
LEEALGQYERELIQRALEQNRYNLTRTAAQLKITRHALRYRMQRLNMAAETEEEEAPAAGSDANT